MANGIEDLKEKNKDSKEKNSKVQKHYDEWRIFQGKEDAEMLQEKSTSWKNKNDWFKAYNSTDYD